MTHRVLLTAAGALAGLALAAPAAGAAAPSDRDPWECAAGGAKPGWCQTASVDTIELRDGAGTVLAAADCRTGRAPDPADRPGGLCADWGLDHADPMFGPARAAGAAVVERHTVTPAGGDRRWTVTVPAPGAAETAIRMVSHGGTWSPAFDLTTTVQVSGPDAGTTAARIPLYTQADRRARGARAARAARAARRGQR